MITRYLYAFGFAAICVVLLSGFYLQFVFDLQPCPLCTLQRVCFSVLGGIFFLGMVFHPGRLLSTAFSLLAILFSVFGVILAGRQVYLQHSQTITPGECGVGIRYMLDVLPITEVVKKIFNGSTECANKGFELFYLGVADWALVWFLVFFTFSMYLLKRSLAK